MKDEELNFLRSFFKVARWVPRLFIIDQKRTRKDISEQFLTVLKGNVQDFWRRLLHARDEITFEAVGSAW